MTRVRSCPRCLKSSLIPTGAYWSCTTCWYAITHAALCFEYLGIPMRNQQRRPLEKLESSISV